MKKLSLIIPLTLMIGCSTTHGPQYKFPQNQKNECYGSMNYAKACIESKGIHTNLRSHGCEIKKVNGERKNGKYWVWNYKGAWVGGLCSGSIIKVSCNPSTGLIENFEFLDHEFGHHWLMMNGENGGHIPPYGECFIFWKGADGQAEFKSLSIIDLENEISIQQYIKEVPENEPYCIVGQDMAILGFKLED